MINRCMTQLVDELVEDGIPDPLAAPFTLAAVWDDLARLAGERPPRAVRIHCQDGVPLRDATPHVATPDGRGVAGVRSPRRP